jgi:TRAP transporter TAXI family solute receptor
MGGTPGGGFQPLAEALASVYRAAGMRVEVRQSDGSVSNVRAIEAGDADVGLAYADVAYSAFTGRLEGLPGACTHLRSLAVLELTPVHLVVRRGAGIETVAELRGRRVAVGTPGSGSALTAHTVMRAFGLSDGDVRAESLSYNEAARRLGDATLDAMFVTGSIPLESIQRSARAGARLLPLTGAAIVRLEREYPFFRPTVIPGGTYAGHPEPVRTIGVDNLLVARQGLDEALAYELTARLFDALPEISGRFGLLRLMSVARAPAAPVPLHEGAARYYRERELSR